MMPPGGPGPPPHATLTDDRGTTTTAHFGGQSSDSEWNGHLSSPVALARDTAWIELDGTRIELVDRRAPVDVSVDELPPEEPAFRHLWHRLASRDHFHRPPESLQAAIDALIAAGALSSEDPTMEDVQAVNSALHNGQVQAGPRPLPEPWRSLVARGGHHDGPSGIVPLGVIAPSLDGISVAVLLMESVEEGFEVEVEVAPDVVRHLPFDTSVDQPDVVWWAADDRGNHYLGTIGQWSGADGTGSGSIGFSPALDPKATQLRLMPTAATARAVISIELPWSTPAGTQADT